MPFTLLRTKTDTGTPDTARHTAQTLPDASDCATMPFGRYTKVVCLFRMLDDTVQLADNSTTIDVRVMLMDRESGAIGGADDTTTTGHDIWMPFYAEIPAGVEFTVQLSAVTNPPAGMDGLEVYWAPQ